MRNRYKPITLISLPFVAFFVLNTLFPLKIDKEYSPIILSQKDEFMHSYLTADDKWRMYTTLEEITPTLKQAILFKEDRFFYYHPGINPISIFRALIYNVFTGRRTSGASTITMQVARMLAPKERTYGNKVVEMFRALQLEWQFSKDEIFQLYLNLVPYGGNIEGVKSAAVLYFNKMPDHLSLAETTTLAIIPNRPNSLRLGRYNGFVQQERNKWLERFRVAGLFNEEAINDAINEPLSAMRTGSPQKAPHLSLRLKNQFPSQILIRSSVDMNIQTKTQAVLQQYIRQIYHRQIKNAVALVVDNATLQVKAYVGSADYHNPEDAGQVDGIRAIRSPGSTLKPFLYGLAIDQGLITPKTKIADVPVNFRGYQPQNYEEKFNGQVTIEYALAHSLNIPAVKVLDQIQPYVFIQELSKAGFAQIEKDKGHLGLSTVLGGCGVSLEELTVLYSAFANGGKKGKLNFLKTDTASFTQNILTKEANYMIAEVLTSVVRPDLPAHWQEAQNLPKVAWKTGTSYGRRDAWSIGFNKKYTVGVWVGNFSGHGVQELTGAGVAAPLLFKIFNAVDQESSKDWFAMPKGVNFRYVCSESGLTQSDFCNQEIIDYYIPGVSDYRNCLHSKFIYVSADSSKSYCQTCLPENGYVKALYPNYAADLLDYFETEKINYVKIPSHDETCERVFVEGAPKITSPVNRLEYLVDKTDSLQIMLSCQAANNVDRVFWYINDRFHESASANENIYFTPKEGEIKISCADDKGRHSDIKIDVKRISF
ncbi:MAG: penicillin-binding protein 1C [Reichenbachiella sp.]|uniref:penicillin-binding protein 1C n=1 Tax=Reichenbachiella sp. TaxID=2184521 RepID=UPI003264BCC1